MLTDKLPSDVAPALRILQNRSSFDSSQIYPLDWSGPEPKGRSIGTVSRHSRHPVMADLSSLADRIRGQVWSDPKAMEEILGNRQVSHVDFDGVEVAAARVNEVLDFLRLPRQQTPQLMWKVCHEASFVDETFFAFDSISLLWHVAGPAKSHELPNLESASMMDVGSLVLFDPMQPHGFRLAMHAGQVFDDLRQVSLPPAMPNDLTVFLDVQVPLTDKLRKDLGIRTGTVPGCRTAQTFVDPLNGGSRMLIA